MKLESIPPSAEVKHDVPINPIQKEKDDLDNLYDWDDKESDHHKAGEGKAKPLVGSSDNK